jgi:hypothetical protein
MNPIFDCLLPSKGSQIIVQYNSSSGVVGFFSSHFFFAALCCLGVAVYSTLALNFASTNLLTIIGFVICLDALFTF